jgi:hypothetical protein
VVFADWAAFCAFLTSETRPVAMTNNRLIPAAILITVRGRRQDGEMVELAFIFGNPAGTEADPIF